MALEIHAITTTVACSVSGGEGHLSAELDSRPYGLNGGRSQYFPGDSAYVLIYKSINVEIKGSFCTGGASFVTNDPSPIGYNVVREGIAFSSPVSNISKPTDTLTQLDSKLILCGGFTHLPNTTVVRLKEWTGSGDPGAQPPYGFVFVEYNPIAFAGKFSGLPKPPSGSVFSWPVHGVIYGVATPVYE